MVRRLSRRSCLHKCERGRSACRPTTGRSVLASVRPASTSRDRRTRRVCFYLRGRGYKLLTWSRRRRRGLIHSTRHRRRRSRKFRWSPRITRHVGPGSRKTCLPRRLADFMLAHRPLTCSLDVDYEGDNAGDAPMYSRPPAVTHVNIGLHETVTVPLVTKVKQPHVNTSHVGSTPRHEFHAPSIPFSQDLVVATPSHSFYDIRTQSKAIVRPGRPESRRARLPHFSLSFPLDRQHTCTLYSHMLLGATTSKGNISMTTQLSSSLMQLGRLLCLLCLAI